MAFFLRKLDRKAVFHKVDWLMDGDVQADALHDLRTYSNTLSIWIVEEELGNLDRIIAALTATRQTIDKFDYALLDERFLSQIGVDRVQVKGKSCDDFANDLWHHDLRGLSGLKLVELASLMQ